MSTSVAIVPSTVLPLSGLASCTLRLVDREPERARYYASAVTGNIWEIIGDVCRCLYGCKGEWELALSSKDEIERQPILRATTRYCAIAEAKAMREAASGAKVRYYATASHLWKYEDGKLGTYCLASDTRWLTANNSEDRTRDVYGARLLSATDDESAIREAWPEPQPAQYGSWVVECSCQGSPKPCKFHDYGFSHTDSPTVFASRQEAQQEIDRNPAQRKRHLRIVPAPQPAAAQSAAPAPAPDPAREWAEKHVQVDGAYVLIKYDSGAIMCGVVGREKEIGSECYENWLRHSHAAAFRAGADHERARVLGLCEDRKRLYGARELAADIRSGRKVEAQ